MQKAGCKVTPDEIKKEREFFYQCVEHSPFMRRRLTLLRLSRMIDPNSNFFQTRKYEV
jgi:hypothetical protein